MIKIVWLLLSLSLIVLVFLRAPQNSGLASFATKSNLLGSLGSAEKFLNNLTVAGIFGYLIVAIQFNFNDLL
jgi:protein translocase SecG subunit